MKRLTSYTTHMCVMRAYSQKINQSLFQGISGQTCGEGNSYGGLFFDFISYIALHI